MKIHYISPFRSDKNIGKAINDAIIQLNGNENDWICLTDHDVLWLLPDSKSQLQHILSETEYDILGPGTNRLANDTQLVAGMFDLTDIKKHIEIAKILQTTQPYEVVATRATLAAFCLCFRIKTWHKLAGFAEKSIQFDTIFCNNAIKEGLKMGVMCGIYLFHLYRMQSHNPKHDIKHLL